MNFVLSASVLQSLLPRKRWLVHQTSDSGKVLYAQTFFTRDGAERAAKAALPPDQRLFADLAAPRYRVTARGIQVEDKDQIKKRLGRSPDRGDAVVLAAKRTPILRDNRR